MVSCNLSKFSAFATIVILTDSQNEPSHIPPLAQQIFDAIVAERLHILAQLIEPLSGDELGALYSAFGYSPLTQACSLGDFECAQMLLTHGVNVNALDYNGSFALETAMWGEFIELSELLLSRGADPYQMDKVSGHHLDFVNEDHPCFDLLTRYRRMYDLRSHLMDVAPQATETPPKAPGPKF